MEILTVLEKKVASLIDTIKQLKLQNDQLMAENSQLAERLLMIETSVHADAKRVEELDQEKALTKLVVDDLIKSIDSLIESEKQL